MIVTLTLSESVSIRNALKHYRKFLEVSNLLPFDNANEIIEVDKLINTFADAIEKANGDCIQLELTY